VARGKFDPSVKVDIREGLYVHYHQEKYQGPWFKTLPQTPLEPDQALVVFNKFGAVIWNLSTGETLWKSNVTVQDD